jgi:PAS domain S-box-containing protein
LLIVVGVRMLQPDIGNSLHIDNIQYDELYNFIPYGCFTLDQNGIIVEVNKCGENLLGIHKLDLLKNKLLRYVCPNSHASFYDNSQTAISTKKTARCDIQLLRKTGGVLSVKATIQCLPREKIKFLIVLERHDEIKEQKLNFSDVICHQLKIPFITLNDHINNGHNFGFYFLINEISSTKSAT